MASVFGAWAPNSSNNARGQLIVAYTVPTPTAGQTSITVTGEVYIKAGPYSWNDSSNQLSWSGTLLGAGSVSNININLSGNAQQTIRSFSKVVTLTSSAQGLTLAFALTGVNYINATPSVSTTVAIPAQVTSGGGGGGGGGSAPATPTNLQASYNVASNNFTLTWGGGLVQRIEVASKPLNDGDWESFEEVSDGSGFASGTNAPAITPGRSYQYRVLRRNASGNSNWAYSPITDATTTPNTPPVITVTQNSDSSHTIDWVFTPSSTEHTPKSFVIERWRASTGLWVVMASPWYATRSWSDTTDLKNDRIQWRVAAKNNSGQSGWASSAYNMTTPDAATGVTAARSGSSSADISWTTNTPTSSGVTQDLQYSTSLDGSSWTAWANFSGKTGLSGALQSTSVTGLDAARQYRFRIITNVSPPAHSRTSAASGSIQLPSAPDAPTPLTPLSYSVNSSVTAVRHSWEHNTIDGSPQTAFRLRYRSVTNPASPGSWVITTGGDTDYYDMTMGVGDWEWQVQTKGSYATYSEYSPSIIYSVYDPPYVTITSPSGSVVTTNRPTVNYSYYDSRGAQKTQIRRLLNGSGQVIEEVRTNTTQKSFQFSTLLSNFSSYTVEVVAVSNTGLESPPDSHGFNTDFLVPGQPEITGQWNPETGIASIQGLNNDGASPTIYNRLDRSVDKGRTWVPIQEGLGFNPQVLDEFARLNTEVWWRLVSISALGTETPSDPLILMTETMHSWLHYGPQQQYSIRLCAEIENDLTFTTGVKVHRLLGRKKRVSVHTLDWDPEVRIKVSASVLDEFVGDTEREVMLAAQDDVYWRDYQQREMWAVIPDGDGSPAWKYSFFGFTLEEVEGKGRPGG